MQECFSHFRLDEWFIAHLKRAYDGSSIVKSAFTATDHFKCVAMIPPGNRPKGFIEHGSANMTIIFSMNIDLEN